MPREPLQLNPSQAELAPASVLLLRSAQLFAILLLSVHVFLAAVGVVGLVEWFLPEPPWPAIANPLFPRTMLLFEWLFLLATGLLFVVGYLKRWRHTPLAMTFAYLALASMCAVQTFGYLVHEARFRQMGVEYAEYVIILLFLFRAKTMRARFGADRSQP